MKWEEGLTITGQVGLFAVDASAGDVCFGGFDSCDGMWVKRDGGRHGCRV